MRQTIEQISRLGQVAHAIVDNWPGVIAPRGGAEIAVGLEGPTGDRRWPRYDNLVAGSRDGQVGRAGGLHDGNRTPKTAGQRISAAGHRAAGVRLADGAGDLIGRAGAGAAAAGDFIPVNRVLLGVRRRCNKQQSDE